jgi:hypothetical protein
MARITKKVGLFFFLKAEKYAVQNFKFKNEFKFDTLTSKFSDHFSAVTL